MKNTLKRLCAVLLSVLLIITAVYVPSEANKAIAEGIYMLPESVDNSTSPYFPEVGNQGSMGSCTSWAHVYYSFTYAMNKSRGIKTTSENTYSPQWSYNLTSNGEGEGSTAADIEWFLEKQGGVYLSQVPYEEDPVTWCSDINVWRESINNRLADTIKYKGFGYEKTQVTSPDDDDLREVKTALANGNILTFNTHINTWVTTTLTVNSDAPENAKFEGEKAVKYQDGAEGPHAMTIVGYNDNLWVDINANGKVDAGEMGAFKIANSWGTGYGNDGFMWIAYDAVNKYSSVNGVEGVADRAMIISGIEGVVVRPYGQGTDIYIKYNCKAGNRRDNYIIITAEEDGTPYTYKAFFPLLTLVSGEAKIPYDGNMLISLDNVIPNITAQNFSDYTWSVTFVDKLRDDCQTTYRNAEIVIESTGQIFKPQGEFPITLNGEEKTLQFSETSHNHAVVYYRGYANPLISYRLGDEWFNSFSMESNTEREGYVHKYVIDLKDKTEAELYFTDGNGSKDNNTGKNFKVTKGLNYFVTQGVAEPMKIDVTLDADVIERCMNHQYSTEVSGGYAPYSYKYIFKNLETGEEDLSSGSENYQTYGKIINTTGRYRLTVEVTDFEGTVAEKSVEFEVVDSPFEFADFKVEGEDELFVGKPVDFYAETRLENIQRFGISREQYDIVITKDGKVCFEGVIDPTTVDHNKMTSTIDFSWTPDEAGHYTAKISGTDFGKDYAEKTIEFDVYNKAYIYYRGFYSPVVNYKTADGIWEQKAMESNLEEYGYVNRIVIDLENSQNTQIYFSDSKGNKDDNGGELYTVKAGKSYFVTQGVCDLLKAELSADKAMTEPNASVSFNAKVSGGYSPYTYLYCAENTATGEKTYSEAGAELTDYTCAFNTEGIYKVTLYVTDFAGNSTESVTEIAVVTPTEAPTTETEPETEEATVASSTASVDETEPASSYTLAQTTAEATQPTEITEEIIGIMGDTNADGRVNIKDATVIQKYIAKMTAGVELNTEISDCFKDGKINIKDATLIQKYLAKYETENVGEPVIKYTVVTLPIPATVTVTATESEAETTSAEVVTTAGPTEVTSPETSTAEPTEPVATEPTATAAVEPTQVPAETETQAVTEITEPTELPTEIPTEPEPEVRTVTFTNSFSWSGDIKCYYWSDSDTAMTSWPGVAMSNAGTNDFGETLYTFDVPEGVSWIIFTNGDSQTVDIPYSGEARYYPSNVTNEKGHFSVEMW